MYRPYWLGRLWVTLTAFLYQSFNRLLYCMLVNTLQAVAALLVFPCNLPAVNSALLHVVPEYWCWRLFPANKWLLCWIKQSIQVSMFACAISQLTGVASPVLLCSTLFPTQCTYACSWQALHNIHLHFAIQLGKCPFSSSYCYYFEELWLSSSAL